MIHFTVAIPLGIDSVFFSFVERLALHNGHSCVDPPAQQLNEEDPNSWIEALKQSNQHNFIIGYRYPPTYWKTIAESASSVILVADPDGIARQVNSIQQERQKSGETSDLLTCVQAIQHALDYTIELAEWILSKNSSQVSILPPATAFFSHPLDSFRRIECFYRKAGVSIHSSCCEDFTREAVPLLQTIKPADPCARNEIDKLLRLENATPLRMDAISILISGGEGDLDRLPKMHTMQGSQ